MSDEIGYIEFDDRGDLKGIEISVSEKLRCSKAQQLENVFLRPSGIVLAWLEMQNEQNRKHTRG